DPHRRPDLRRCNGPAAPEAALPVTEGLAQVINHHPNGGGARVGDWLAPGAENGIAQEPYAVNGHRFLEPFARQGSRVGQYGTQQRRNPARLVVLSATPDTAANRL